MSNYLAIATTTAVFAQKIYNAMSKVEDLSAAPIIYTKRPEKQDGQLIGAYLYLYKVEHNNTLRNNDLATRRVDGSLIQQPQVALNLSYHLSFYGQESTLESQRLLGSTITALHAEPLITPNEIKKYLDAAGPHSYLANSNLYKQKASIKIEPVILSLEDISKMWTVFFQVPHEQSLNYEVSVLLMESDLNIEKSLPAQDINLFINPSAIMEIQSIEPAYLEYPANKTQTITLKCKGLNPDIELEFIEAQIKLKPNFISQEKIQVAIPQEIKSGINNIRLIKTIGNKAKNFQTYSEVAQIIIQPVISNIQSQQVISPKTNEKISVITMEMQPALNAEQHITLWLNQLPSSPEKGYFNIKEILSFVVSLDSQNLNKGISDELTEAFHLQNIELSKDLTLTQKTQNIWTLKDNHSNCFFSLRNIQSKIICYYGFADSPKDDEISFILKNDVKGDFLVRVQIDNLQFAESLLEKETTPGASFGHYIEPKVSVS